ATDPAGRTGSLNLGCRRGECEVTRVTTHHPLDEVDLLQRRGDGRRALERARDEHGPELTPHSAATQPGNVGLQLGHARREVGLIEVVAVQLTQGPRQVVVSIDHVRRQAHANYPFWPRGLIPQPVSRYPPTRGTSKGAAAP